MSYRPVRESRILAEYLAEKEALLKQSPGRSRDPAKSGYFSRSRDLLSSRKDTPKSPRMGYLSSPKSVLLNSPEVRPSSALKKSTKPSHRVKFDLDGEERPSGDRKSQRGELTSPKYSKSTSELRNKLQHDELNERMQLLESKMEAELRHSTSPRRNHTELAEYSSRSPRRSPIRSPSSRRVPSGAVERPEEVTYSKEYVDQIRARYQQEIEALENRLNEKTKELHTYKRESDYKTEELYKELERLRRNHNEQIVHIEKEIEYQNNKRIEEYEFENKRLRTKIRDLEDNIVKLESKLELTQKDNQNLQLANSSLIAEQKSIINRLEDQITNMKHEHNREIQDLNSRFENERKKQKESYEKLIEELSNEIKQLYEKMNDELAHKDKQIRDLEFERGDIINNLNAQIENLTQELETAHETNRIQKRTVEEYKREVLRLNSQLEDRKRELRMLETQMDYVKAEKSRAEAQLLRESRVEKSDYKSSLLGSAHRPGLSASSFSTLRKGY